MTIHEKMNAHRESYGAGLRAGFVVGAVVGGFAFFLLGLIIGFTYWG